MASVPTNSTNQQRHSRPVPNPVGCSRTCARGTVHKHGSSGRYQTPTSNKLQNRHSTVPHPSLHSPQRARACEERQSHAEAGDSSPAHATVSQSKQILACETPDWCVSSTITPSKLRSLKSEKSYIKIVSLIGNVSQLAHRLLSMHEALDSILSTT